MLWDKNRRPRPRAGPPEEGCEEGFLKPSRMIEALTVPPAVPALGRDVSTDIEPTRWTYRLKK
jgi:hypothetical protein